MPNSSEHSVLRQKASRTDSAQRGKSGVFGRPLIRAAESELGLKLSVRSEQSSSMGLQDVLDQAGDAMFLVLDGPDGQTGAMLLDHGFVAQVTEFLTMGRMGSFVQRPMTRTDAALLQPFVDKALSKLHAANDDGDHYRFGAFVPDAHGLGILLESTQFLLRTVQVEIGAGEGQADIRLVLPKRMVKQQDTANTGRSAGGASSLRATLMDTQISVQVTLHAARMSFDALRNLKPEDTIPVPSSALKHASLICGGEQFAQGVLGQLNGQWAVKISGNTAPKRHSHAQTAEDSDRQDAARSELALPV